MTNVQSNFLDFSSPNVETHDGKPGYAPVLALAFILWPIAAVLGIQGFTIIIAITGLAAVAFVKPKRPSISDVLLLLLFMVWIIASQFWSPASGQIISGNIFAGNFAVKSKALSMTGLIGLALMTIYASRRIPRGSGQFSAQIMIVAFLVQGVMVVASPIIAPTFIDAIYANNPEEKFSEGIQNLMRNANAFAMIMPILLGYFWVRKGITWRIVPVLIVLASLWAFYRLDAQSAILATLVSLAFMGYVHLVSQGGLQHILRGSAVYIALAPLVVGFAVRILPLTSSSLPSSFRSRSWAWERVTEYIGQSPLLGHGINASDTWRETYSDYPERLAGLPADWAGFPVIPGHPHNMPLEIWAETGLIGALLISWAVFVMALRFSNAERIRADIRYATAGLIGTVIVFSSTAYSVWNDAYWAGVALAAAGIILLSKRHRGSIDR